jgi:hypothetical protein
MTRWPKRSRRRQRLMVPRRRSIRTLFAETLEQRVLLTTVTGVVPAGNTHLAPVSTEISATFDQAVDGGTASIDTLAIHSMQRGRLVDASVTTTGPTVTVDPAMDFFAGELVQATATSGIQDTTAQAVDPYVWQFRTAVTSGGALFRASEQLGSHESVGVSLGDLDGDGDLDAFVANRRAGNRVWVNNGGLFTDSGQSLGGHDSFGVFLGDLDGDGDLDAFVANLSQGNRVWINDGGLFVDSGQSLGRGNSLDVSLGDIDGDGDLDAVVANALQGNRVWLNSGGVFAGGQYLGGSSSNAIVLGDLDADGDLDVFVANSYQPNRIWLNDGGQFADSGQSLGNRSSRDVSLGDVDGDGDLDAFVANSYQANHLWINDGAVFTDSGQGFGSNPSYGISLGDLDADGDLDAFVSNAGSGNRVLRNDGGIFSDTGQALGSDGSAAVSLGDIDRDGDLDAFVANANQNRVWLNHNPTFFVSPGTVALAEGNSAVAALSFTVTRAFDTRGAVTVDFSVTPEGVDPAEPDDFAGSVFPSGTLSFGDGVGSLTIDVQVVGDVVVENDETFLITLANPVGQNSTIGSGQARGVIRNDDAVDLGDLPTPFPTLLAENGAAHNASGPTLGSARDIDPDGQPTAAADGDDANGTPDDEDGVSFAAPVAVGQGSATVIVNASADAALDAWIDFNGDGSFGGPLEQIATRQNVVAGDNIITFAVPSTARQGQTYSRFRLSTSGGLAPTGGAPDGEVEDHPMTITSPVGGGVFGDSGQNLGSHSSLDVALGDVDGDGDLDALVANGNHEGDRIWLNEAGTFSDSGQSLGDHNSADIAIGDLDGDGDLDAFVANDSGNRIWFNTSGVLSDSGQSLGVKNSSGVALGDLDGDGDLDAFVANDGEDNRVWLNDDGVFAESGQSLGNSASRAVSLGDLDGDGDLDAFVANYRQANNIWLNHGGEFSSAGQSLGDHHSWSVALGDLDGDGDLDAAVANGDQGNRIWTNQGGVFTDSGQTIGDHFTFDVALGDLDGDGDLDAFVANGSSGNILVPAAGNRVLMNSGGVFSDFGQPLGDHVSFGVAVGDLDGDGDLDAFSANYFVAGSPAPRVPQGNRVWLNLQGNVLVAIAATDSVKAEGDTDTTPFAFAITRTGNLAGSTTVNYAVAGTGADPADAADFGGAFPSGVVNFAVDQTSQIVTINVSGDTLVETDEAFNITLSNLAPDTAEILTATAAGTIENDDLTPLTVFLSVDNTDILENRGIATFSATLSTTATSDVTVDLGITGTATSAEDFVASGTQIVIEAGELSGEITVTSVDDLVDEDDETVIVAITIATNAAVGNAQRTTTITDDDDPRKLQVTSLIATSSGFLARFSDRLDESTLNLYDSVVAGRGLSDVVLEGQATGLVTGSLRIDQTAVEFVKSGTPLLPDVYTVTLRSAEDGFKSKIDALLDGDGDGNAGDDFTQSFTIAPPPASAVTVSLPDFTRGPGQEVNVPADTATGIPLSVSEGDGLTSIGLQLGYDPSLLNFFNATVATGMPEGSTVSFNVINNTATSGVVRVTFSSPTALSAGSQTFVNLHATVPAGNANAIYAGHQVLDLRAVTATTIGNIPRPVVEDDAVHLVSFFGDVSANGRINAGDASQLGRVAVLSDGGFGGTPLVDPLVAGDITGNGRINSADASFVAQFAVLNPVPEIPPLPAGIVIAAGGGLLANLPFALADPADDGLETIAREQAADNRDAPSWLMQLDDVFNAPSEAEPGRSEPHSGSLAASRDELETLDAALAELFDE